jgi:hypothetical protein
METAVRVLSHAFGLDTGPRTKPPERRVSGEGLIADTRRCTAHGSRAPEELMQRGTDFLAANMRCSAAP